MSMSGKVLLSGLPNGDNGLPGTARLPNNGRRCRKLSAIKRVTCTAYPFNGCRRRRGSCLAFSERDAKLNLRIIPRFVSALKNNCHVPFPRDVIARTDFPTFRNMNAYARVSFVFTYRRAQHAPRVMNFNVNSSAAVCLRGFLSRGRKRMTHDPCDPLPIVV